MFFNLALLFEVLEETGLNPWYNRFFPTENRPGPVAEKKDMIRGQLLLDTGDKVRTENSHFNGPHYVECYVIKNGVCLARDRIDVPIRESVTVTQ